MEDFRSEIAEKQASDKIELLEHISASERRMEDRLERLEMLILQGRKDKEPVQNQDTHSQAELTSRPDDAEPPVRDGWRGRPDASGSRVDPATRGYPPVSGLLGSRPGEFRTPVGGGGALSYSRAVVAAGDASAREAGVRRGRRNAWRRTTVRRRAHIRPHRNVPRCPGEAPSKPRGSPMERKGTD